MIMAIFFPIISPHMTVLWKAVSKLSKRQIVGQEQIWERIKQKTDHLQHQYFMKHTEIKEESPLDWWHSNKSNASCFWKDFF